MSDAIDIFDYVAFLVFIATFAAGVVIVVTLGTLPSKIAAKRDHPQIALISIASWVGIGMLALGMVLGGAEALSLTMMGILWPLALVWAFFKPYSIGPVGKEAAS